MKICVCGACGKMGKEVIKTIDKENDMQLVLAVDYLNVGKNINTVINNNINNENIIIRNDLKNALLEIKPDVMIELTSSKSVFKNTKISLECKIPTIIGATGLTKKEINILKAISKINKIGVLLVSNFSIGAILMMNFATQAIKYFKNLEIIEYHHDQKIDAPSGTSLTTAELIKKNLKKHNQGNPNEKEILKGARGADFNGFKIHSIRLPGFVAHQEIIFGNNGQLLTIRHDSMTRESFMPGVILSLRNIIGKKEFIEGLDTFL